MYAGILPTWAVVTINAAFYGYFLWIGVIFALAAIRKEEKAIWVAGAAEVALTPACVLVPSINSFLQLVKTGLCLIAFLAALAILVSIWGERVRKEPS
jgi:hypothetical protein